MLERYIYNKLWNFVSSSQTKAAFQSLMKLWNSGYLKNLGSRTSESVLAILCHILRGESVIAERLKQIRAEDAASGSVEGAAGTSNALSNRSRLGGASSFLPSEILGGWGGSRQQRQEPSEEHIQQVRRLKDIYIYISNGVWWLTLKSTYKWKQINHGQQSVLLSRNIPGKIYLIRKSFISGTVLKIKVCVLS